MTGSADINALGRAAVTALQGGDGPTARRHLEAIIAAGHEDKDVWLMLGIARHAMSDPRAAIEALDKALGYDSRNPRALMVKGDCLTELGDKRSANTFYKALVDQVPDMAGLPPDVAAEIQRAKDAIESNNAEMLAHTEAALAEAGFHRARSSARFAASVDMLAGRRGRYVEEPTSYFFPGLPAVEFYPRQDFPWLEELEAASDDIAAELAAALAEDASFKPYIHAHENRPVNRDHSLLDSMEWSALFLWEDGTYVQENARRFPKTLAALEKAPLERIEGKGPMALFSRLEPGAHIKPHHGALNTRLLCHLPIVAPGQCYLRVGGETRGWEKGEAFVFSDAIEHEAWNESAESRIVLIFSIWRPDLTEEERGLVASLLRSVESYPASAAKPA